MSQSWMFGVACIVSAAAYDILEFGTWNAANCPSLAASTVTQIAGVCTSTGKYACTATELKVYTSHNNCGSLAFTYTFGQCTSASPYQKATKHTSVDNYYIKLTDSQTPAGITYWPSGHCTITGSMSSKWTRVSSTQVNYSNWPTSQTCSGTPTTLSGAPGTQAGSWTQGAYPKVEVMTATSANMCPGSAAATTGGTNVGGNNTSGLTSASIVPRVTVATLAPALFMALWSLW